MAGNDEWCTPPDVLAIVRQIGPIALDPCSNEASQVGAAFECRLPEHDGLAFDWSGLGEDGLVFVNPPYSDPLPWVRRALDQADRAVLLLPTDTSTRWFHAPIEAERNTSLAFFRRRLAFIGKEGKTVKGNRGGSVLVLISEISIDHLRFAEALSPVAAVWSYSGRTRASKAA